MTADPIDFATVPVTGEPTADRCYLHRFGAYGETVVAIFAEHLEQAAELAFEWLDEHAPGHLARFTDADYTEAAAELGLTWLTWPPEPGLPADLTNEYLSVDFERITAHAEVDHTECTHTTLTNGTHVRAWEWHTGEVQDAASVRTLRRRFCAHCDRALEGADWPLCEGCEADWVRSLTDDLMAERADIDDAFRSEGAEDSDEPSIDVRIQVTSWGAGYKLRTGDSQYDQDHRGAWGASSLGKADSDDAVHALAAELIDQAAEAAALSDD